jgi:sarcosine oxidase subunit beta
MVDVAIIGGGAIGWSTAWRLLHREPSLRVEVIDPHPERASSLRGTGGVRCQFEAEVHVRLSLESIEFFERFEHHTGHDVGFQQNGYLLLSAKEETAERLERAVEFQSGIGAQSRLLTVSEIDFATPFVRRGGYRVAAFCPQDGYLMGPEVLHGFRQAAMRMGATERNERALRLEGDEVRTSGGSVWTSLVVLSAGHWSAVVAEGLGLAVPVRPEKHQLVHAGSPCDPSLPMIVDLDTGFHFRPYLGGTLMGFNDARVAASTEDPEDQPAFDASAQMRMRAVAREAIPQPHWATAEGWAGWYSCTPDGIGIVDRVGQVVIACGFGGHGVMHAPAVGRIVADLVLDGEAAGIDIAPMRYGRFAEAGPTRESWVL